MSFFNEKRLEAMETGRYYCSKCNHLMEFEDEWEDSLICPSCGHSVDIDHYGVEDDEAYEALYPTKEEVEGSSDDEEADCNGETYDEVYGELDND